jgi:hypothetical protein
MASLMDLFPGGALVDVLGKVIDRVIPDKAAAQQAKDALAKAQNDEDFQAEMGQIKINLAQINSGNWFVAGPRPAIMWVCAGALFLAYIPMEVMQTFLWSWQCISIMSHAADPAKVVLPAFPDLGISAILGLLVPLLGLGTMRTIEKYTKSQGNR